MKALTICIPLLLSAGCASTPTPVIPPRPLSVSADSAEYAPYQSSGTLELTGQAFLTTRGGDVKLAAGRLVTLDPATTYAQEWFRRFGADVSRFDVAPPEPLFISARRTTTADAQGRFRFAGLPAGPYLVRTTVTWETGSAYSGLQGGVVAALVKVQAPPGAEVIVNQVFNPTLSGALGVSIVSDAELATRRSRLISRVTGVSCQIGLIDAEPNEEDARNNLVANAAALGADAVGRIVCQKHGMSFRRPSCMSRIQCEGDAIAWM